jgi:hypothetical protein
VRLEYHWYEVILSVISTLMLNLIEDDEQDYDREKYREMLLDAAETILSCFGFSRSLYGDTSRRNKRKWWYGLREERMKDIETERSLG